MKSTVTTKTRTNAGLLLALLFAAAFALSATGLIPVKRQAAAQSPHPDAARFIVSGGTADIGTDINGKPVITLNNPSEEHIGVTVDYDRYISVGDWMDGNKKIVDFTPRAEDGLWVNCAIGDAGLWGAVMVTMEDSADPSQQLVYAVKGAHNKPGELCFAAGFSDVGVHVAAFQQFLDSASRPFIGKNFGTGNYDSVDGHPGADRFYHPGDNINGFFFVYDNTARVMNTWNREKESGSTYNMLELDNQQVIDNYANGDESITEIPGLFTSGWFKIRFTFCGVAPGGAAFTVNSIGSDDFNGGIPPAPSAWPGEVFETTAADTNGGTQKTLVRANIPVSEFASNPLLDMRLQTDLSASYFAAVIQDSQDSSKQIVVKFSKLNSYQGGGFNDGMGASLSETSVRAGTAAIGRDRGSWWSWPGFTDCSTPLGTITGSYAGGSSNFIEGNFRYTVGFNYTGSNAALGCYAGGECAACSGAVLHDCVDDSYNWTTQNLAGAGWSTSSGADWQTASKTADAGNAALYNDSYILNLFGGTVDVYVFAGAAASVKVFRCGSQNFGNLSSAVSAPASVEVYGGLKYPVSALAKQGKVTGGWFNVSELPLADVEAFNVFDVKYVSGAVAFAAGDYLIFSCGAASARADISLLSAPAVISGLPASFTRRVSQSLSDSGAGAFPSLPDGASLTAEVYAAADTGKNNLITSSLTDIFAKAGAYTVYYTLTLADGGFYEGDAALTVQKLELSVSAVTPAPRAYNGLASIAFTGGVLSGAVQGADVGINIALSVASAGFGADKPVTVSWSLTGADAANYSLPAAPTNLTVSVSKAPLSITAAALAAKTYDGSAAVNVTSVTFGGLQNSESFALGAGFTATAAFDNANAGAAKAATVTVTLGGTMSNYELTANTFGLTNQTLGKAAQNAPDAPQAAGAPSGIIVTNPAAGAEYKLVDGSNSVIEDWSANYVFTGLALGEYTVYARMPETGNYFASAERASAVIEIIKADRSHTVTLGGWTYGATANSPALNAAPAESAAVTYYYDSAAGGAFTSAVKPANAGTYYVRAYIAETAGYNAFTTAAVQFVIAKAKLAAPAADGTYTANGVEQTLVLSGFDAGTMELSGQKTGKDAGSYTAEVTIKDTANYEWADGAFDGRITWTIKAAEITETPPKAKCGESASVFAGLFIMLCAALLIKRNGLK